jgi:hypothetical protein
MIKSCSLLLGALVLVIVLFFFAVFLPQYKESVSYLIVAVLMTMIIGHSKASIFAKLIAWAIIWIAIGYILIF